MAELPGGTVTFLFADIEDRRAAPWPRSGQRQGPVTLPIDETGLVLLEELVQRALYDVARSRRQYLLVFKP